HAALSSFSHSDQILVVRPHKPRITSHSEASGSRPGGISKDGQGIAKNHRAAENRPCAKCRSPLLSKIAAFSSDVHWRMAMRSEPLCVRRWGGAATDSARR